LGVPDFGSMKELYLLFISGETNPGKGGGCVNMLESSL